MNRLRRAAAGTLFYKNTVSLALLILILAVAYSVYDNVQARARASLRTNQTISALQGALRDLNSAQAAAAKAALLAAAAKQQSEANGLLLRQLIEQRGVQATLIASLRQQLLDAGITPVVVTPPSHSPKP